MHSRESRHRTVTKFAAFVHFVRDAMCTKFCSKRTTFDKVIVKKLKIQTDPSSLTRAWPPSVLILRQLINDGSCLPAHMAGLTARHSQRPP